METPPVNSELRDLMVRRDASPYTRFDVGEFDVWPCLRPCRVKILMLVDAMISFNHATFGLSAVLDTLQDEHRVIRSRFARISRPERADQLIEMLAAQARDTGALLRERRRVEFQWVTLAETLSLAETADAIASLTAARLEVTTLVVNRVLPDGPACDRCDPRRLEQRRVIAQAATTVARGRVLRR